MTCGEINKLSKQEFQPFVPTYDYIKFSDYTRPLIGAATFGLVLSFIVSALAFCLSGPLMAGMMFLICLAVYTVQFPLGFLLSAFMHHCLFLHRLRKHGPTWYMRQQALDVSKEEAFELCLAACGQFDRARIIDYDEQNGLVRLQVKGNFWITVDRLVAIQVKETGPRQSTLYVDSQIKLTRFRSRLIKATWGEKWHPIVFRTDRNLNNKLMNVITNYIDSVPNWDHRHVSVQEKLENLDNYVHPVAEVSEQNGDTVSGAEAA